MTSLEGSSEEILYNETVTEKQNALKIFNNISESSQQVLKLVNSLNEKVRESQLEVNHGFDLLDVKNQVLAQYLLNLAQVIILKATGKTLEGNPAVERLIENRIVLERTRPIEQKVLYQIDKYIKIYVNGNLAGNDPNRFRANPADMLSKNSDEEEDTESENEDTRESKSKNETKKYVPPKLTSVEYEGDETGVARQKKLYERARKQALRSAVIQELKEEYLDTPVEVKATNSLQQQEDKFQKMKREYEETYFTRLPVTREEKQKAKKKFSLGSLGDAITNFEDTSVLHGGTSYLNKKRKSKAKIKGKFMKRRHH